MKLLRLKSLILLFTLLLLSQPLLARTDWSHGVINQAEVIQQAALITPASFPNADEVVIDEFIHEEYRTDGSSLLWDDEYIKVLTEKGKRGLQSRSLHFTLPYGTAEYKKIEIIKPDGTLIPIDLARQSRVMIDPSQMGSNIYNPNDKLYQVTIPGLEINDILHLLSFRDTVKARAKDTWSSYEVFEYTSPIRHLIYDVKGPKSFPLKNIRLKDPVPGTVRATTGESENHLLYRWEITDVPRMYAEPQMPALHTVVQRLLISTIKNWQEVSVWYWNLSEPHLNAVTPAMKKKTADLISTAKTRDDKIHALFQYVSKEIRYMGITTEKEAPGYEPHDVSLTFENRYGVCRDKAALLVSLLRIAGLDAYPVLIMVGPIKDNDVPQPYFNHAIVGVRNPDGTYILMDPTNENTKELLPAYLCNRSYLVAHPQGETLLVSPIIPADKNLVKIESKGRVTAPGTLKMKSTLLFEGINDSAYRGFFARRKPEERKKYCEGVVKDVVAGAKITHLKISPADLQDMSQPLTIHIAYEAPNYLIKGREVVMLDPPILGARIGYINFVLGQTGLKQRKYAMMTEIACGVEETFHIDLQNSVEKIVSLPVYNTITTPKTAFTLNLAMQNTTLSGNGFFKLKGVEYTPEEYQTLKQSLKDIEFEYKKRPVFAKTPQDSQPDVRILEKTTEIKFLNAGSWRTRIRIKKKILTYAGKKAHAELKLAYNPVWTELTLKKAVVKDRRGKRHRVVADEINTMDAAWAGAAPRYPAAKTMVVSLPGVEIGSEIEYEIESVQRGRPFFSLQKTFSGFDPIDKETLIIQAPASVPLQIKDLSGKNIAYQKQGSGTVTHTWQARHQTPLKLEDSLPPLWSFNPNILISTGDWKTFTRQVQAALNKASDRQPATAAKAMALTKNLKTNEEKIIAIRDFVAKQIRPAGPSLSQLPLTAITPADQTLAEGYGNNADQAVVIYAMLKAIERKPGFILAAASAHVPALRDPLVAFPEYGFFDHVLVRLVHNRQPIYLNDSSQYAHLGTTLFDQRLGLDMAGNIFTIHGLPKTSVRSEDLYTIKIKPNGDARIIWTKRYFGPDYAAFHRRFAELPPEERNRYFQELVAGLSQNAIAQGKLITDYQAHPGVRIFTVNVKRFAVRSGNRLYFNLPRSLASVFGLRADTRENPFYHPTQDTLQVHYAIQLPGSTRRIMLLPENLTLQAPDPLGTITYTSDWDAKKKKLNILRRINLKGAVIDAKHYDRLLKIQRTLDHPATATIMVEL